ncbi:hypothetical protein AU468_13505 [Alkalispirochaeta sphaeroplastigenens]|uniref:O-antigen polymerase n=1 Tax=Alkalispirochaeta sphaeroplastigenens TaxID=1187066 RepID=A0A2S4JFS7_9SPIO|nr:hypothetical protein AU468_13505 [Alkalispirochaeta sphaeroplastigenens]
MVLLFCQPATLLLYLNRNIINVGEFGIALPVLAAYMGLSLLVSAFLWLNQSLFVRFHFFAFLLLMVWIALRVIVDLGDLEHLKAISVATTGGMLLFYLTGSFFSIAYRDLLKAKNATIVIKLTVLLFLGLVILMFSSLLSRLRSDIFYITGVDGAYQRPGNFLSISFIIFSSLVILLFAKDQRLFKKSLRFLFWLSIYSGTALLALISTQLFGSNSATAVITGVYIVTVIVLFLMGNKRLRSAHSRGLLALPMSKRTIRGALSYSGIGIVILLSSVCALIQITNFDITTIRLLGFGSGSNRSLSSRVEILLETGIAQMGYAPLLGNMNVAYLTTGNAGRTLHSFFPFVLANLGLVGLLVIITLFTMVFRQLYRSARRESVPEGSLTMSLIILYFILILTFLLIFSNLTVGVSWSVMWFTVGFFSQPFVFKKRRLHCETNTAYFS